MVFLPGYRSFLTKELLNRLYERQELVNTKVVSDIPDSDIEEVFIRSSYLTFDQLN